jgi:hypothetical protein
MDRQGYEGTGSYETGHKPVGQAIKEMIPGTEEHRMRDLGVTGHTHDTAGHNVGTGHVGTGTGYQGTGYTGTDTGYTGTGAGYTGAAHPGASVQERVKAAVPGTNEYEATHGMTGAHRTVEQAKAYVPGTEEHCIHEATRPVGAGTGMTGTGVDHTGVGHTGGMGTMGATDTGYGTGATGAGYGVEGEKKSIGQKIKEVIPGTHEHEAKKMDEGRF